VEPNWANLCSEATSLTSDEARDLEQRLANAPDDVRLRGELLGAGFLSRDPVVVARRVEHLAWLAEHRPDIDLCGFASIVPDMVEEVRRFEQLWIAALSRHPDDVRVLRAGARFLSWHEPALALRAYERGAGLEPDEGDWKHDIAHMHERLARDTNDEVTRRTHLQAAQAALDQALSMASRGVGRSILLQDLAWNAVALEEWENATTLAERVLGSAEACRGTWQYGNAIHHGHMVLGEVALARGELDRAEEELQAAGTTPGSPQLDTFGPRLGLAGALARLGRREAVIKYLESCRKFWTHRPELPEWVAALQRGELPGFAIEDTASDEQGESGFT
jgi:hypothetical protein